MGKPTFFGLWLAFIIFSAPSSSLADEPLWTTELDEAVKWSRLTPAGSLVFAGTDTLTHVNTTDGSILWKREGMHNLGPFNLRFAGIAPVMVVSQLVRKTPSRNNLQVLDMVTGETIWETGVRNGRSLGGYTYAHRDLVFFVREANGEKGIEDGVYVSAHELSSGRLLWLTRLGNKGVLPTHPIEDNGFNSGSDLSGHPDPIVARDVVYLTAGDIWALSLSDGSIRWQYNLNASMENLKRTYTRPKLIGDVLYAAGSNRVVALDAESGNVVWETKLGRAAIPELTVAGDKLIGRMGGTFSTGKRLQQAKPFGAFAIDRTTGELGWQWKEAQDSITNLGIFQSLDQIVLADKHSLYTLRLSGDKPEVLGEQPLEFKRAIGKSEVVARGIGAVGGFFNSGLSGARKGFSGGERNDPPLDITQVDTSVVVRGQYHVLAHDLESGENTWSIEFAPPGVGPFALITMGAVATGLAVWNARDNVSRESWAADSANSISTAYQNEASRRFTASERSARLAFFLTMQEKAHQLVGIDLETGDEVGTIPIAEKDPQFMVDALGRRVYHFADQKSLRAFAF